MKQDAEVARTDRHARIEGFLLPNVTDISRILRAFSTRQYVCHMTHTTGEPGILSRGQNTRHKRHQEAGLLGEGGHLVVAGILLGLPVRCLLYLLLRGTHK